MDLRHYQLAAVDSVLTWLETGKSCLLVMATGTGKTVVFSEIAGRHLASPAGKRVLVLAHRDELIWQAKHKLGAIMPGCLIEVEMGQEYQAAASKDSLYKSVSSVVVASKDTLWRAGRLRKFDRDEFSLIIIDEGHHAVKANKTYQAIIDYFHTAKVLGVTATADRSDGRALGQTYEHVAYTYDILTAINDGFLVPLVQQLLTVEGYDLSGLKTAKDGDFKDTDLDRVVRQEKVLHGICHPVIQLSNLDNGWGRARPTIVFAPSVATAKLMADIFNRHHALHGTGSAVCLSNDAIGKDERRSIIDRYRAGEIRYLTNFGILTEGFDAPETRIIVMARATKSRLLYAQMIGRGTRPSDNIVGALNGAADPDARRQIIRGSNKPGVLIVDPVGVSGKHKLITTADLLGGWYDQEIIELAKKSLAKKGGRGVIQEELIAAKKLVEAQESKRRERVIIQASFSMRTVDPFSLYDVGYERERSHFKGTPATHKQVRLLERFGVSSSEISGLNKGQAGKMLDGIFKRIREGKATLNQVRFLGKHGVDARELTKDQATEVIDAIKANGWRLPAGLTVSPVPDGGGK